VTSPDSHAPRGRIPLPAKLLCTAFVVVLVPVYWRTWGPQNFLYFCDVALLVTCVGMWIESPLLIGMEAVAILLPQAVWIADLIGTLFGKPPLGLTAYMFNPHYALSGRVLSLFHGWLPLLLLWLVKRLGYDRRALVCQTIAGIALMTICYACFDPPGTPGSARAFNLNYVFGLDGPQKWMPPILWFGLVTAGLPLLVYVPTHLLLKRSFGKPAASGIRARHDSVSTGK
jgi:hypothetical protein